MEGGKQIADHGSFSGWCRQRRWVMEISVHVVVGDGSE